MNSLQRASRGFTIVELMITLTLLGILLALSLPSFTTFIRDSQLRTAAAAIENGLQLARAEAVRRNDEVQFTLLGTLDGAAAGAAGPDWSVVAARPVTTPLVFDQPVQVRRESSTSSRARVGVADAVGAAAAPGANMPRIITFTGLGRLTTTTAARQIDITGVDGGRRLSVLLTPGGEIRLCDPAVPVATNPQGCT